MTVTLTPELEEIVKQQLATGQFATQDEVVRVALLNLRRQYDELKAAIAESVAQADRGELAPFDPAAILAEAKAARLRKQEKGS
jgi:putative addiction module CopG family antidote